jgi:hypothetical protein
MHQKHPPAKIAVFVPAAVGSTAFASKAVIPKSSAQNFVII